MKMRIFLVRTFIENKKEYDRSSKNEEDRPRMDRWKMELLSLDRGN